MIDWQNIEQVSAFLLNQLPQQRPFRFLDEIVEVDATHIVGRYTFRSDESFYQGHFPGRPVTPGVILIETMAQTGVVAFGIYLAATDLRMTPEELQGNLFLFTDCQAEFLKQVGPGETVVVKAQREVWRRRKLRVKASIFLDNGDLAAEATISGLGVKA